jgi:5'-3' exonuclease
MFPADQSGREFDDALLEQLDLIPKFVTACGFQNAKAPGFEADEFLAAASAAEERRGGTVLIASGDRDTFQLASDRPTTLYPVRGQGLARINPAEVRAATAARRSRSRFKVACLFTGTLIPRAAHQEIRGCFWNACCSDHGQK